jgi:hypothetical protein
MLLARARSARVASARHAAATRAVVQVKVRLMMKQGRQRQNNEDVCDMPTH